MTDQIDLREFVGGFVVEAEELIGVANAALLEVDEAIAQGTTRPRAVRELFRALHTLKGLAGMIGVEPIVELAHELETLVRAADKGGGTLRRPAVEVALQAVGAIAERVRAVAENRTPAPAPEGLLAQIAVTDSAADAPKLAPAALPAWEGRLGPAELQLVAQAFAAGVPIWTIVFVPSAGLAATGVTIATVRARVAALGELVKVTPKSTPGGVAFELLLTGATTLEAVAAAAATTADRITRVDPPAPVPVVPAAPLPAEVLGDTDHATPIGRAVVRVELARLDALQEQLSSLVVSRFRLEHEVAALVEHGHEVRRLREILELQGRQLRELRRAILRARMVRVADVLEPLALLVRSLTRTAGKEVRLELDTRDTEVDKAVADRLLPALVHLVRNAVDHAIEPVAERLAARKPRAGTLRVTCTESGGSRLELAITDDGRGIDRAAVARKAGRSVDDDAALLDVLTTSGFSTRDVVSQTSGRGLGMDIVRRITETDLGGELALSTTPGAGTTFRLRVPLTIAIIDVFSFACGTQSFVVPVAVVEEIFELGDATSVQPPVRDGTRAPVSLLHRRGQALPLVSLGVLLAIDSGAGARKAMVIRRNGELLAFGVDRMLGRQEVVVRPIEDPLARVPGIAGATDLGTGRPTLVLDLLELGAELGRRRDRPGLA